MPITVFAVVLFAAALHASWNAVVKVGDDKFLSTALVMGSAAALSAAILPFLPQPARAAWPFLAGSTLLQIGYYVMLARIYHVADMSQTYPLMRGAAPLIVGLFSSLWLGEPLSAPAWLGVAAICGGVLSMVWAGGAGARRDGYALALLNAVLIAGYTLVDGYGVRRSGAPAAYTLWLSLLSGSIFAARALIARPAPFMGYVRRAWRSGLVGGAGSIAAYGLALWAMTVAPVAVVAALRETSILFGAAIARLLLKERLGWARISAICLIAAGAAALRLA